MDINQLVDFLGFSVGDLERLVLIITRLTGLIITAPFFSRSAGPPQIRAAFVFITALILWPLVPPWSGEGSGNIPGMFLAGTQELMIGAILGIFVHWAFAAVQMAGSMMGFEMGLSMAQVMDPTSGAQVGVLGNMFYWGAMVIFLAMNGHHTLLLALTDSFKVLPLGSGFPAGADMAQAAVGAVMRLFKIGLLIATPVIAASKLLYLGLGLINRASPQIQVFFVAMPVAQMLGFTVITLTVAAFGHVVIREFEAFMILGLNLLGMGVK